MRTNEFLARLISLPEIVTRLKTESFAPGTHRPQWRSRGIEFEGSVPFIYGVDDRKDYDTRLSKKLDKPMKKVTREEKESLFFCLADMRPSMSFGQVRIKREFALEVAGVLALSALENGDRAGIAGLQAEEHISAGSGGRMQDAIIFKLLALYKTAHGQDDYDITPMLREAANVIAARASVFVVSDFIFSPDADSHKPLKEQSAYVNVRSALEALTLQRQRELGLVVIRDVRDSQIPRGMHQVRSSGRSMILDGSSRHHRQVLTELEQERNDWLAELRQRISADHCFLDTCQDFSYATELITFIAKRHF